MKIRRIYKRGVLFTFDELNTPPFNCTTNVYVIIGKDTYYICDTYLGSYYVKQIKQYLESNHGLKEYVVFNSHFHWDHIWGNSEFEDSRIIAHEKCRDFIDKYGEDDLKTYKEQFSKDDVRIVLPNELFDNKMVMEDDNIEFFYSPGHTEDSASCFDYEDKTLFVGDNIDNPIPSFLDWNDLETYKATLENYLSYNPDRVVQSHGDVMEPDIITSNIEYLNDLMEGKQLDFGSGEVKQKHLSNLEFLKNKQ